METGVYCWRNVVNGKVYVGSSSRSLIGRRDTHLHDLRYSKHHSPHFQAAYAKYGEVSFVFEILEHCPPEQCIEREQYWMDELQAVDPLFGYNIAPTAGSALGTRRSPEQLRRLKIIAEKRASDPEWLDKLRKGIALRSVDPVWLAKNREATRKRSNENKEWKKNQADAMRKVAKERHEELVTQVTSQKLKRARKLAASRSRSVLFLLKNRLVLKAARQAKENGSVE